MSNLGAKRVTSRCELRARNLITLHQGQGNKCCNFIKYTPVQRFKITKKIQLFTQNCYFIKYAVIQKYFGVISNLHVPKKLHKLSKYTDQA